MHKNKPNLQEQSAGQYQLVGDVTFATVPSLTAYPELAHEETQVDLSQVGRVDSAGLALLVSWVNFAKKRQRSLYFVKIPPQVDAMIEMRGLRGILYANKSS